MSTYKVIQDVEAEDKLVGPLTLRQFIYAAVAAVSLYISFILITKHAAFLLGITGPIALISGFFAFPWKGEQPTEIWALARIRFMILPRVRIWDQSGMKDLVKVNAPIRLETHFTNGLSQSEVKSRLRTLADTIDSRGWAIKNADGKIYNQPNPLVGQNSDRLVNPDGMPREVSNIEMPASDMMDDQGTVAQQFDSMLNKSNQAHRERVIEEISQAQHGQLPAPVTASVEGPLLATAPPPNVITPTSKTPVGADGVTPAGTIPAVDPTLLVGLQPANGQLSQVPPNDFSYAQSNQDAASGQANDYWFLNGPAYPGSAHQSSNVVAPGTNTQDLPAAIAGEPTAEEKALAEKLKAQHETTQQISYGHLHIIQPLSVPGGKGQPAPSNQPNQGLIDYTGSQSQVHGAQAPVPEPPKQPKVTRQPDPAILELANNDDLDIATIARQANKQLRKSPDEIEIHLH